MAQANFAVVALALALALPCTAAGLPELGQPQWGELSPQQKLILAPLSDDWSAMGDVSRKKWLGIAHRYPAMSEEEQARVQRRMKKWAVLSPDERRKARDQYRKLQNISPDQREQL